MAQYPSKRKLKRSSQTLVILFMVVGLLVVLLMLWHRHSERRVSSVSSTATNQASKKSNLATEPAQFNKHRYSYNDPASLWVVVNKGRVLPSTYVPANLVAPDVILRYSASNPEMLLRSDAAAALKNLFEAAMSSGLKLMLASGYRSYSEQVSVYDGYVKSDGRANADQFSARPGHSEHQTGLAADIAPASGKCVIEQCFAQTAEGQWIAINAYKYGFILRYSADKEPVTGYGYEPWHLRYIGTSLSSQMHAQKIKTLEEFFGLSFYPDYPINSYDLMSGR